MLPSLLVLPLAVQSPVPQAVPELPAPPPHKLGYFVTQSGLEPPTFEGGRTELECADVNGDGHVDVLSIGDHGSPYIGTDQHGIMVWRGDGRKGYSLVMTGDLGYGGIAVGDVNGDGLQDVGYGMHHNYSGVDLGDQLLEVALGDGTGAGWTAWDDGLATTGESWGMFCTDFGDVDGDGDLDVGANAFGCCSGVRVYLNDGGGTWTPALVAGTGSNSDMDLVFCDFTGDGHLDVVASSSAGVTYRGDGAGAFALAPLPTSAYYGTSSGDLDGDGADEVAVIASSKPQLWRWSPGDVWTNVTGSVTGPGTYELTQMHDLDSDGDVDLIALGRGTLSYWLNDGAGALAAPKTGTVPGMNSKYAEAFRVSADLDHNGYADMVLVQDEYSLFGGGHNEMYAVYESSTPSQSWIRPLEPSPNRTWRGGQVRFATWASAVRDPSAGAGLVTIDLSTTGPLGPWTTLATSVPNSGRHQLTAPLGVTSSSCFLRLLLHLPGGGTEVGHTRHPFRIAP